MPDKCPIVRKSILSLQFPMSNMNEKWKLADESKGNILSVSDIQIDFSLL